MKRLLSIAALTTLSAAALLPLSAAAQTRVHVVIGDPVRVHHGGYHRHTAPVHYYRDDYGHDRRAWDARRGRYVESYRWVDRNHDGMRDRDRWDRHDRRGRRDLDRDGVPDRHDRDLDNDGIANRYDRDVDGDGVRNSRDYRPGNPYRY